MDPTTRQAVNAISEALEEGRDVAEFLATALAHVAAAEGGVEEVLRNRPGSWEATHIRGLLHGTVGHDEEALTHYREESR
ncbi:hypothetical protein [Streptomyces sp. NPDC048340]|uniref:hypothetical protein n=1 Tax=Streptomyces sp. NPDC048340 TaxID=3365537 RepID=UPI003719E761